MVNSTAYTLLEQYKTQLDQSFAIHQDADVALSQWLFANFSKAQLLVLLTAVLNDKEILAK